jgi:hypothetical protein
LALDFAAGQRGMVAHGIVITRWLSHLLAIDVAMEALTELRDAPLSWYVGLSSDATRINSHSERTENDFVMKSRRGNGAEPSGDWPTPTVAAPAGGTRPSSISSQGFIISMSGRTLV